MSALDAFLRSPAATHLASGATGHTRILRAFTNATGQSCRIVEQTVFITGSRVRADGTVCRRADGRWIFVDQPL